MTYPTDDTIVALSTPPGTGAIAVIRLSGSDAVPIVNRVFFGKNLAQQPSHTVHVGTIRRAEEVLDEVVVALFLAPRSFTQEDVVEVSCHGSPFIVQQLLQLLVQQGARLATPGEFTKRAFLSGRFDLAQAEAVADLIASESQRAYRAAMNQMRGGFSQQIKSLRDQLVYFASLVELELDFSEEDVEFADRKQLETLVEDIRRVVTHLIDSFAAGNVIKNGVPIVIAGKPNVGKSTLLNALLNEEKAIVSEIPGTTRDFIEDEITLDGVLFRFIDTAGIRKTEDQIELLGVQRTHEKIQQAAVVLYLIDLTQDSYESVEKERQWLLHVGKPFVLVGNKIDQASPELLRRLRTKDDIVYVSAEKKQNLEGLRNRLAGFLSEHGLTTQEETVVTNTRHYTSLLRTHQALKSIADGLQMGITHDFLAQDIRHALYHLGEITGEVTNDDLLDTIFSKFCIGK